MSEWGSRSTVGLSGTGVDLCVQDPGGTILLVAFCVSSCPHNASIDLSHCYLYFKINTSNVIANVNSVYNIVSRLEGGLPNHAPALMVSSLWGKKVGFQPYAMDTTLHAVRGRVPAADAGRKPHAYSLVIFFVCLLIHMKGWILLIAKVFNSRHSEQQMAQSH